MNAQPYDIFWIRLRFNESEDERPCVVLEVHDNDTVSVVRLSSATDLVNPLFHFQINILHPDFAATGLLKTGYCDGSKILTIKSDKLVRKVGSLRGGLAIEFSRWIG